MEVWKDIKGYEGYYQISNLGNVKSCNRQIKRLNHLKNLKEKLKKSTLDKGTGYYCVVLSKNNKRNKCYIHRLVAEAFIPNPDNLPFVNHKDETRTNNRIENLEWCTPLYNNTYGTLLKRLKNLKGKIIYQYDLEGHFIKKWESSMEISRTLKLSQSNIIKCCKGKRNKVGGFIWRYE